MWKSKCINLSARLLNSQIRSRESVIVKKSYCLVSVNRYFNNESVSGGVRNDFIGGQILSCRSRRDGILTSKLNVRHSSTSSTIDAVNQNSALLDYLPTGELRELIIWVQSTTCLPWWASLVLYTFVFRVSVQLPISIYQKHLMYRYANVQSEIVGHRWRLKNEMKTKALKNSWSKKKENRELAKSISEEKRKMYVNYNCHPAKLGITIGTLLLAFMTQVCAIRELCIIPPISGVSEITSLELITGGFGWFENLTEQDQFYILPVIATVLTLVNIKASNILYPLSPHSSNLLKILRKSTTFIYPAVTMLFTTQLPTAVVIAWITSNIFSFGELILFAQPKFRRLIKLPKVENELDKPIMTLANVVREKLAFATMKKKSSSSPSS
ncbi:cytochrome c oxidase assembly protein COX18, mitochondrial-like [Leptopilina heterotoma]|uniref:cytochrome c oxidase assembly protein COX18, mitochondrial-like n=1 Tax=Leptopilina heterotoma TaxID=63436 RepID=UPI001CAA2915|nr:cytochrome c oxidase assembly protein COX18, mitochondrial-like [Leptopilina heterotoma]